MEREGLGYAMRMPDVATELAVRQVHRERGDVVGELSVACALPGIPSATGDLFMGRFNLSRLTDRRSLASHLAGKTPETGIAWPDLLELFCAGVLRHESNGVTTIRVGRLPVTRVDPPLVEPLLPAGKATILFGDGGVGKGYLAVALAVSVMTGRTVIPGFTPSAVGSVLYLDWEDDEAEADLRVKRVCAGVGIAPDELPEMSWRRMPRILAADVEEVAAEVQARGDRLVIVDSVGLAAGTSAEGADAAEAALRFMAAVRHLGTTALLIDHVTKATASVAGGDRKPYGSGYKAFLARSTWELRQARPTGDGRTHAALYQRKANTTARHAPIGLAMSFGEHGDTGSVRWEREEITADDLDDGSSVADRIAAALRFHPLRPKEIATDTGLSEAQVRAELNRQKSRFGKIATGDWAVIEGGREEGSGDAS